MDILLVYDRHGNPLGSLDSDDVIDLELNHKGNQIHTGSFRIPFDAPGANLLLGERRIRTFERDGVTEEDEYIISDYKIIRDSSNKKFIQVTMELNAAELMEIISMITSQIAVTCKTALDTILAGTGWTCPYAESTKIRSYEDEYDKNILEMVSIIHEKWGGIIIYNSLQKQIYQYDTYGRETGYTIEYQKNIKSITKTVDYKDHTTVLWPFGENDLMVHTAKPDGVNEYGLGYVENYSWYTGIDPITGDPIPGMGLINPDTGLKYTDEEARAYFKKERVWRDATYVEPDALYFEAVKQLREKCKPSISYEIDLVELYALTGSDDYKLWDWVTVRDTELGIDVRVQIVEITRTPTRKSQGKVVLSTKKEDLGDIFRMTVRNASLVDSQKGAIDALGKSDKIKKILRGVLELYDTDIDGGLTAIAMTDAEGNEMRLTTTGLLLKTPETPDWATAITGRGIFADSITGGKLNAALVTIIGSEIDKDLLYFNGDGIFLKEDVSTGNYSHLDKTGHKVYVHNDQDPENPIKVAHFGRYSELERGLWLKGGYITIDGGLPDSEIASSEDWNTVYTAFDDFITYTYSQDLADIQNQLDGKIETYFQDPDPATWPSSDNEKHDGDMWYSNATKQLKRFDGTLGGWVLIEDQTAIDAYQAAQEAQDTADGKRRVFTTTPVPPYDVGDLWTGGINGDLKRCKVAKPLGGIYNAGDWEDATRYGPGVDSAVKKDTDYVNGLRFDTTLGLLVTSGSYKTTMSGSAGFKIEHYSTSWQTKFWAQPNGDLYVKGEIDCSDLRINGQSILTSNKISGSYITNINAGSITTGTLSANRINTAGLSAERIYKPGSPSRYLTIGGSYTDLKLIDDTGIAIFEVYDNLDSIYLRSYDFAFLYHFSLSHVTQPCGTWDFSQCTVQNLTAVAVFG